MGVANVIISNLIGICRIGLSQIDLSKQERIKKIRDFFGKIGNEIKNNDNEEFVLKIHEVAKEIFPTYESFQIQIDDIAFPSYQIIFEMKQTHRNRISQLFETFAHSSNEIPPAEDIETVFSYLEEELKTLEQRPKKNYNSDSDREEEKTIPFCKMENENSEEEISTTNSIMGSELFQNSISNILAVLEQIRAYYCGFVEDYGRVLKFLLDLYQQQTPTNEIKVSCHNFLCKINLQTLEIIQIQEQFNAVKEDYSERFISQCMEIQAFLLSLNGDDHTFDFKNLLDRMEKNPNTSVFDLMVYEKKEVSIDYPKKNISENAEFRIGIILNEIKELFKDFSDDFSLISTFLVMLVEKQIPQEKIIENVEIFQTEISPDKYSEMISQKPDIFNIFLNCCVKVRCIQDELQKQNNSLNLKFLIENMQNLRFAIPQSLLETKENTEQEKYQFKKRKKPS